MTYKTLQTNFERELLFEIIFEMKQKSLTNKNAHLIAKAFMGVLKKVETKKEFLDEMSKIARYYPEIQRAFTKVAAEYEMEFRSEQIAKVQKTLQKFIIGGEI